MARANTLLWLSYMLLAIVASTTAHPFRHQRLERRPIHRQINHGIHRRSDTTMDAPQVKESLHSRYASAFALPIATLERLRSDTLASIEAREESYESTTRSAIELPFTVEQLQEKLEAFMQSLTDDLVALLGSNSPTAASGPAAPSFTTDPTAVTTLSPAVLSTDPFGSFGTTPSSPPALLPTTLITAQFTFTRTLTVQQPTLGTSLQPVSTPSTISANHSNPYVFDPMANDNVVVYYGQTTQTSAVPLTEICADPSVDIVILAFVPTFFGPGGWPTLNMGPHCWAASTAQSQAGATGLIDCVSDGFATQVQQCQDVGKKVLLSLGGAQGYSNTTMPSDQDAKTLASTLWDLFLGGTGIPQTNAIRPFGNVVLDGLDIGEPLQMKRTASSLSSVTILFFMHYCPHNSHALSRQRIRHNSAYRASDLCAPRPVPVLCSHKTLLSLRRTPMPAPRRLHPPLLYADDS